MRSRAIAWLARMLTHGFFRSVETEGHVPHDGPVILAASHLNGFVDPVVLTAELGTLPRFLAKATLWNVAVARPFLAFARVIPVHRRQDSAGGVDNSATFASAVDALAERGLLAVFPEGTTHDDPTIRPLRTGVARIALQAASSGVQGVTIVPVGVTYEDKVAVRGRVLVSFGDPIPVTVAAGEQVTDESGDLSHERVRALTGQLQTALEHLTPNFTSTEHELALSAAARISLRQGSGALRPVPVAQVAEVARRLASSGEESIARVVGVVSRYLMLLGFVGLTDDELREGARITLLVRRIVALAVLIVFLAPLAVAGLFANLIPVLLVLVAGLVPKAPVSKGTVRFLVGFVTFPVMWIVIAATDAGTGWLGETAQRVTYPIDALLGPEPADRAGVLRGLVVFVAVPLFGAATLLLAERLRALLASIEAWHTLLDRRGQLPAVRAVRAEVVAATIEVAGMAGARPGEAAALPSPSPPAPGERATLDPPTTPAEPSTTPST